MILALSIVRFLILSDFESYRYP